MDDTWYNISWRVFCIGELGSEFCNRYKNKLNKLDTQFTCCVLNDLCQLKHYLDSETRFQEHWMLIAEYEQEIWNKHLEDDEIKKILQTITLKFIIIHPVNNTLSPVERQFVRLMWDEPSANFNPDFPHTLPLAMPDSSLRSSLEAKCFAIYDMIASVYLQGLVSQNYLDLVGPGEKINHYGMVYKANCTSCEQMDQTAAEITEQVIKDIPTEDMTCVRVMIFSDQEITLNRLANIGDALEHAFNEKTEIVWSQHHVSESEYGITVVVYRKLDEG